jgi:hypothetical protein
MAVATFGVGAADVRDEYFPSLAVFSASTKPSSGAVLKFIQGEGAKLYGALAAKGVSASTIISDAGSSYPNAYAWCQATVSLGAAIRVMQAIAGFGAVPSAWFDLLKQRYESLSQMGYLALGDAPGPEDVANGPRSHISNHDLDTGDEDLISTVVPKFRRDDKL